jgi:hypothetical protein
MENEVLGLMRRPTYVRIEEDLHKRLRHEAAEYDMSLNTCISTLLEEALATRHSSTPTPLHT